MAAKRIPATMLLGQRGVNLVERRVMEMGYVWYPTGSVEAGIDGHIELRNEQTGEVFNSVIGVQSRARSRFDSESEAGFEYRCGEGELSYWLGGNLPVILVVSKPDAEEAYWVSIKEYFSDPARRQLGKVRFDKVKDVFDRGARDRLFALAAPTDSGLYLTPIHRSERLISNLLPVHLPPTIYLAATELRDPRQIYQLARQKGVGIGGEWILRNKLILSFRDLRLPEWHNICDRGSVEEFDRREWSGSEDAETRKDFVFLLNRTLREMLRPDIKYDERSEVYYFRPTRNQTRKTIRYKSLTNAVGRAVAQPYYSDEGSVKYWRHSAFEGRFRQFEGYWFLEVTPTYLYTRDGVYVSNSNAGLLQGIKRIEHHPAVRGQLLMWSAVLTQGRDLFRQEEPFLRFESPKGFDIQRGIDDREWAGSSSEDESDTSDDEPEDEVWTDQQPELREWREPT